MTTNAAQLAEVLHTLAGAVVFHEEAQQIAFHQAIDEACGIAGKGSPDRAGDGDDQDPTGGDDDAEELKGQALKDRAAELDIEGRSDMTADELRAAVAAAEAGE